MMSHLNIFDLLCFGQFKLVVFLLLLLLSSSIGTINASKSEGTRRRILASTTSEAATSSTNNRNRNPPCRDFGRRLRTRTRSENNKEPKKSSFSFPSFSPLLSGRIRERLRASSPLLVSSSSPLERRIIINVPVPVVLHNLLNRIQHSRLSKTIAMSRMRIRVPKSPTAIIATATSLICLYGCKMLAVPKPAHADDTSVFASRQRMARSSQTKKMSHYQIVRRCVNFWIQAAPIIVHYQFTKIYLATNPNLRKLEDKRMKRNNHRLKNSISSENRIDQDKKDHLQQIQQRQARRDEIYNHLHHIYAPRTLSLILQMRGLFVKIGQVLSSRADFMPSHYIDLLQTLQDDVPPISDLEIREIVRDSLGAFHLELEDVFEVDAGVSYGNEVDLHAGLPAGNAFGEVIGAASIGQVHKVILTEKFLKKVKLDEHEQSSARNNDSYRGGKVVAVKVMHRDAKDLFQNDFKILKWLCRLALPGWSPLLLELERQMMTEFDYHHEAMNLNTVRKNMMNSPYRHKVVVPQPITRYSTENVLIMEFLDGVKFEKAVENDLARAFRGDRDLAKSFIREKRIALFEGNLENKKPIEEVQRLRKTLSHFPMHLQFYTILQLACLKRKQKKSVDLLLDVHGHQILANGIFNGDCHPGNILTLSNGKMGLIDYGQCKRLGTDQRIAISNLIKELGSSEANNEAIQGAMHQFGFRFKKNDELDNIQQMARLFFDSDCGSRAAGCTNPQEYYQQLQKVNPFVVCPDEAVFIARTSFLFRGMGSLLGTNIETAKRWSKIL